MEEPPCRLYLSSLCPGGSNLWRAATSGPSPGLCCRGPCDASAGADCQSLCSLCSTCCTSPCTPSPTVGSCPSPSARGLRGSDPSVRRVRALWAAASSRPGCDCGSRPGSGSGTCTERVLPGPPKAPSDRGESAASPSGGNRKTLSESGTSIGIVHNCGRCVESKGNGDKSAHGSGNGSGIDWGSMSKTWTWTWI